VSTSTTDFGKLFKMLTIRTDRYSSHVSLLKRVIL